MPYIRKYVPIDYEEAGGQINDQIAVPRRELTQR
jgi:hypothetical protein